VQSVALLVIAKQPLAGRVKTRLTPPFSPAQAALLAGAALSDTLDAVGSAPAARRVLVFEGDASDWCPDGFEVVAQRPGEFGQRLQGAFEDVGQPALLVGMDTPQLTAGHLRGAVEMLSDPDIDAVLGPTEDGGYWCVGFKSAVAGAFDGVPMSREDTYVHQHRRLRELGLRVGHQPLLRDVDTATDAHVVAAAAPTTRFARTLEAIA